MSRWSHWIWVRLPVQSTSSLARSSCLNPIPSSTLGFVLCSLLLLCAFKFIASSVCKLAQEFSFSLLYSSLHNYLQYYVINSKCSMPDLISVSTLFALVLWSTLIYQIPDLQHACPDLRLSMYQPWMSLNLFQIMHDMTLPRLGQNPNIPLIWWPPWYIVIKTKMCNNVWIKQAPKAGGYAN